jgi:hypothetical protein
MPSGSLDRVRGNRDRWYHVRLVDLLLRPYRGAPRFAYNLIARHSGANGVDR